MSDNISRQAAMAYPLSWEHYDMEHGDRKFICGVESYREYIEHLPSVDGWIPCSERLPEIGEHYVSEPCIVYCSNGAYGFAELEGNIFGQVWWDCERDDEYHEPLGEVLAWMPLEPYKGGAE